MWLFLPCFIKSVLWWEGGGERGARWFLFSLLIDIFIWFRLKILVSTFKWWESGFQLLNQNWSSRSARGRECHNYTDREPWGMYWDWNSDQMPEYLVCCCSNMFLYIEDHVHFEIINQLSNWKYVSNLRWCQSFCISAFWGWVTGTTA